MNASAPVLKLFHYMTNPSKNMLVTLGVRDVEKSRDFYASLGFNVKLDGVNMADFEMDGIRVSL